MNARTELADEIDAANKKLIRQTCDTSHWSELEKTQKELADLLWANKEAIVSYLRAAPSTHHRTPESGSARDTGRYMTAEEIAADKSRIGSSPVTDALRPFAILADFAHPDHKDTRPFIFAFDTAVAQRLTIGDLRRARAALTLSSQHHSTTGE